MKRAVSLILALVMMIGLLPRVPIGAFAAGTDGAEYTALENFTYTLDETAGTVTLTKYVGAEMELMIPASYLVDGRTYEVLLQSETVFAGNSQITSVTIASGAGFADNTMCKLFAGCSNLTAVDMTGVDTSQVTSMRELFSLCKKLTTITGYEDWDTGKVESLFKAFNYVFYTPNANGQMENAVIDLSRWDLRNVKNTGWCFQYCRASQILLPDNLAVISSGFLNHAQKYAGTTFTIPAGVEKIGYGHTIYDFATNDFTEFKVAEGNTHYVAIDGILYSADGREMLAIPRNKPFENGVYEIPEGVTFLGELSFSRNYNIQTLILPDSFVIEYVPARDGRYVIFEDIGNLNAGTNLSIAIYCYTGITAYAVKDSNPNYASREGIIYSKDMTQVVAVPARYAQEISIPEGVTAWNREAMWADVENNSASTLVSLLSDCPGVSIPASLKAISEDQLTMLNLLYTSRKGTSNPFTIKLAEGNTELKLAEDGTLIRTHTHSYVPAVTPPTCMEQGYTTYTCSNCGDSYTADYVDASGHTYENGICVGCGVANWDTDGDGVLEILAIGNSFSIDALEYTYQIARDLDIDKIVIGNLYISGCTLATHANNAAGDLGAYRYYYNDSGIWTTTDNYKISTALESRSWDYVSLQQSSKYSGVESTYNEDLTDLIAYVQERSDAKLVWHMTWAYQQDSTNSAFPIYQSNQMTMYNAIVSAVKNKIVPNTDIDLIVPNGTAVQNSRTSLLGDTTTRDGYHMSRDYGQYLTGLLFIKTVTGLSVDGISYAPSGVDAQEMAIAIESVNNAYADPFAVTESVFTGEAPEEGYILLQGELYKGAFWSPVSAEYDKLFYDRSMSHKYFATIRFTKETLPVGSIIILADGWRYRPDGWVTDTVQPEPRESITTESYVIVTEEWWKDYTIRSFNVSRTDGGSVMELSLEEMREIFRIYVPEDKHSHNYSATVTPPTCTKQGYTTYTCSGCGDSYTADYVDASGHTYENDFCVGCGAENPNPYAGKTIACIGDSITYGVGVTRDETDYVTVLAQDLEMNYIRLGASGTTLCTDGHATCNIGKLTEENLAGADVVTILMGINDFVQARNGYYQLGTIDSTDTSTIYGAVHMWCQRIVQLRQTDSLKDTEFIFLTPVMTSWNNSVSSVRDWDQGKTNIHGYTLRDLCNAIVEVCALYDIPVIDLNLVSGLYYNSAEDNTVSQFGGDGAHPGAVGHQMMAEAIEHALLKDNLRNDHDHSYGSWVTTLYPGCNDGLQQRVCAICTATESRKLDGRGHTWENGICTGCGAVLGDLDLDGDVDASDLTLLARHVGRIQLLTKPTALWNADVTGDGIINSDDLTLLARYVGRIITDWENVPENEGT